MLLLSPPTLTDQLLLLLDDALRFWLPVLILFLIVRAAGPRLSGLFAPAGERLRRRFYLILTVLLAGAACWHLTRWPEPLLPLDDAYIVAHNIQVLHSGHDPNYGSVPALAGSTSPVHLALTAALSLFLSPVWAIAAVSWLAILAYALGLARLAFLHGASWLLAAAVVLLGLTMGLTTHQLLNGLETGLAMASIVWAMVLLIEPRPSLRAGLPALCGLLPFIRPDLAAAALLLLSARLWQNRRNGLTQRRRDAEREQKRGKREEGKEKQGAKRPTPEYLPQSKIQNLKSKIQNFCTLYPVLCTLLFALPWLLWLRLGLGTWLPVTIQAKRLFFAEQDLALGLKGAIVYLALERFGVMLGLFCLSALLTFVTRRGGFALAFAACFLLPYLLELPGALVHNQQRYLYVLPPFLLWSALAATERRLAEIRRLALLLIALSAYQSARDFPYHWREHRSACLRAHREMTGVADWCQAHLPANATLLVHDAGYLAYATRFHLIDLVGLKTPASIGFYQRAQGVNVSQRRAEAIHQIALATRPDYLIVLEGWDSDFHITAGLKAHGWRLEAVRPDEDRPRSIPIDDFFAAGHYAVYKLTPPPILYKRKAIFPKIKLTKIDKK